MQSSTDFSSLLKTNEDKPSIAANLLALKTTLSKSSTDLTKDTEGDFLEHRHFSPLIQIVKNAAGTETVHINLSGYKGCTMDDIRCLMTVIKKLKQHTILDLTETNLSLAEATTLINSLRDKFACRLEIIVDNGYDDGFPGAYEQIHSPFIYEAIIQAIKDGDSKHWPDGLKLHIPVFKPLISAITKGLEGGILPDNFALNINNNSWYPASISSNLEKNLMKAVMNPKCPRGVSINPHYFYYPKTFFNRESFDLIAVISKSNGLQLDITELDKADADKVARTLVSKK